MKLFKKISGLLSSAVSMLGNVGGVIAPAVHVVNVLKAVVNNPALDLVTELTKTGIDDAVLKKLRVALNTIPAKLELSPTNGNELVTALRDMKPTMQNMVYSKTASLLAQSLTGGKLTEAEADTLVQLAYAQHKAATA